MEHKIFETFEIYSKFTTNLVVKIKHMKSLEVENLRFKPMFRHIIKI